eukprot:5193124-Amphidinium_carterae.2
MMRHMPIADEQKKDYQTTMEIHDISNDHNNYKLNIQQTVKGLKEPTKLYKHDEIEVNILSQLDPADEAKPSVPTVEDYNPSDHAELYAVAHDLPQIYRMRENSQDG